MVIFTFIIKKAKKQMSSISTKQSKETRDERSAMVRTWNDRVYNAGGNINWYNSERQSDTTC